ncbi:MAG: GTPase RsgA [Crenarchaeota archaeon]|nr:GTPase RsgA [Thermoproteota archaeon]
MKITVTESWRRVRKVLDDADLVLEVADAREPMETRNVRIEKLAQKLGKPIILVLNKCDLVPFEILEKWKIFLERELPTVFLSAKYRLGTRKLMIYIKKYAPRLPVRVAVVGYPNVGKSTVINYLKGRHVAQTSPVPGWTRGEQIVKAKSWLYVVDTPGVVPIEEVKDEALLIVKGAIDPSRLRDPVYPAVKLIERILRYNPSAFLERYNIDSRDPMKIIEEVARKRGLLLKGGKPNIEAAAQAVIRDWIEGKITYYRLPEEYYAHAEESETTSGVS